MALTSKLKPWYIKALPGMNNKVEDLEQASKWVSIAQNCRFEIEPGSVDKRGPIAYYNPVSLGAGGSLGMYRYYGASGNIKKIYVHGTTCYVGNDSTGTFSAIKTSLTSGKRMAFETYRDLVIMSNGFDDMFVYDGSSDNITWELGSCKAKVGAGVGITATAVSYQVTIDADSYICGAISNTIATVTAQSIDLTNIPLGPDGTVNRKIYRKDSGTAGAYKLVTTIANNTATTYTDTTPSGSLGANIPPVTDDMPKGSILQVHRERLFIAGDPLFPNRIYYSNVYLPWFIQQTTNIDYMQIDADDGDEIMGIPVQLGVMCCVKKNTVRKLQITSATSGADPTSWYAEDPSAWVGAQAQWSIIQTANGIAYMGWDHWYIYDGATTKPFLDEFDVDDILPAMKSQAVAYYLQDDVILLAYSDRELATQYNNRLMVYNVRRQALAYDTVNVSAIVANTGDDETGDVFYGDSTQGIVYKTEISDIFYKLLRKSEVNAGTLNGVFAGGTEASPTISIGAVTAAVSIPTDVMIFWDGTDAPSSGWTEVTGYDDKFIKISTAAIGTTGNVTYSNGTQAIITFSSLRLFSKNASSTEYAFPDGAIVMWDQPGIPVGFQEFSNPGNYIKFNATAASGSESAFIQLAVDVSVDSVTNATDLFTKAAHGLANGNRVTIGGTVIPGGTLSTISYFIVNVTANTFQISLVLAGAAVSLTSDGTAVTYARSDGTNIDQTVSLRFMKKVGEQDTWDGVNNYVYCLYNTAVAPTNGWTDVTSTYDGRYLTVGADAPTTVNGDVTTLTAVDLINLSDTAHIYSSSTTEGLKTHDGDTATGMSCSAGWGARADSSGESRHVFSSARTITSVKFMASGSGSGSGSTDNGVTVGGSIQYALESDPLTWVNFTGGSFTGNANSGGGGGSVSASFSTGGLITITQTVTGVISVRAIINANGYANESGSGGASSTVYEIQAFGPPSQFVTFRLTNKILGQMLDYNTALITPATNGIWVSPGLQLNAETFNEMIWNEDKEVTDEIDFFTRTGSTQSAVENGTSVVATNATNIFTAVGHGNVNGDRVTIGGTVLPAGVVNTRVYFVVGVAGNDFQISLTSGGSAVDFTTDGTAVTFKRWAGPLSDPNGTQITSTADIWFQYLIAFTAADTTVSNPTVYFSDGFVVKFSYSQGEVFAEAAVEWIYSIGRRNFDEPFVDKVFKKICCWHDGTAGSLLVQWETEFESGEFTVDLSAYPKRWESFFPENAWGRDLILTFYKNDVENFRLKEITGLYTPEPIVV